MGDDRVVSLGRQSQFEDALRSFCEKASEALQAAVQAEYEAFLARNCPSHGPSFEFDRRVAPVGQQFRSLLVQPDAIELPAA